VGDEYRFLKCTLVQEAFQILEYCSKKEKGKGIPLHAMKARGGEEV
jgi:hypothetical protein